MSSNILPAAGRMLNEDLAELAWRHGQDHLLLEATFPSNYPDQPLSLRMVAPRCTWCGIRCPPCSMKLQH